MSMFRPLLLIDCGNSALKWQMVAAPEPAVASSQRHLQELLHAPIHRMNNAMVTVDALMRAWSQGLRDVGGIADASWLISWVSVGPLAVRQAVELALQGMTGSQPPEPWVPMKTVGLALPQALSFDNGYADAQQLGADRWISALGLAVQGMMSAGETHMIVSAGTATTMDTVSMDAGDASRVRFVGGWIFPGVQLMHQSLRSGTRDLQYAMDDMVLMDRSIPADSRTAIAQGVALAQIGAIGLLARRHHVTKLWLHGGGSAVWRSWLDAVAQEEGLSLTVHEQPQLPFAGLYAMARLRRSAG